MKSFLKFILYAGAVVCCLVGLWVAYVAIVNFRELQYPSWVVVLVMEVLFVFWSFVPAFMLLIGHKTKTWHWAFMGIVEAIVLGITLFAIIFWMGLVHGG